MRVTRFFRRACAAAAGLWATSLLAAAPVGTAFTYQGQLKDGGTPANGAYDLQFSLFDAASGGGQVGSLLQFNDRRINDGLLTVTLDFGSGVFSGSARWLQIAVRRAGSIGSFTPLSPRQALTPAPYAMYALDAADAGGFWEASGSDIHNTNAGKVGIGTATPTGLLGVESTSAVHGVWSVVPDIAIYGHRTGTTGTWPAVHGECDSVSANASAVRGILNSTNAGAFSAAVRGVNHGTDGDGAGIYGLHDGSGTGVHGECSAGTGVFGVGHEAGVMGKAFDAGGWGGVFLGSGSYGAGQALMAAGDSNLYGAVQVGAGGTGDATAKLNVLGGTDTSPTGGGYVVVGSAGETNIAMDDNEIMARNAGSTSTLHLNHQGGNVLISAGGDGNVGIGTSLPLYRLEVRDESSGATALHSHGTGTGVWGSSAAGGYGVFGQTPYNESGWGVYASGRLGSSGPKAFHIDHPLDPANKYLNHYSAEGPDPLLIYRGNVVLDANGEAWVQLPDYFESINRDYHYQLTCVGRFAPVYVAEEIRDGRFKIAGGQRGVKVSWTVTGVRNDAFVRVSGAPVETEKPEQERGKYLHPELFGKPADLAIHPLPASRNSE